MMFSTKI